METAAAAVGSLLPKLREAYLLLLNQDRDRHQRDAAEILIRELTSIHAALRDAAAAARAHASPEPEQPHDDNQQGSGRAWAWAGAARELAYDVDDAVDALLVTSSLPPEPARGHDGLPPPPPSSVSLHRLLQRATELSSRIADAGEVEAPVPPATTVSQPDLDDDEEVVLVGADGARDGLIRRLRLHGTEEDDGQVNACDRKATMAVAVVGSVGLGKTALARSAYGVLRHLFDCAAFVSVGSHPRIESVLQSLLRQLGFTFTDDAAAAAAATQEQRDDERELIDQLSGFLQNKRYLIVVDDLWDTMSWDKIRCALIDNNRGSRIIATTSNFDVAEQVGTPYELKPLSAEDSRTLFFRTLFGHEDNKCYPDDDEFTKVAEKFSEKCGGVPLAIVTVAKMLASKMGNKREWPNFSSGLENTPDVKKMRMVTARGYYNLPPHLRACLLYMSAFPEGSEIRRGRLVWRWIAEGFVHFSEDEKNKKVESLFELGESYVDELVNRSMIQFLDVDYADGDDSGRDECCYSVTFPVMDLISHLSSQETFITVLDDDEQQQTSSQIRRASLRGRSKTEDSACVATISISMPPQLRSLSVFSPGNAAKIDLSTAAFLCVLDLEGCDLSSSHLLQNHLGNLVHLRYLGLRDTRIAAVPESIGKLRSLQTLDLADNTKLDELPASVVELGDLMCLRVYYRTRVPAGIGRLTALEELSDVSTRGEAPDDLVEELGRLTNLRVLRMTLWKPPSGRQEEEALLESLLRLRSLQVLDIYVSGAVGGGDPCQRRLDTVREDWAPPRRLREFQARAMNTFSSPLRALPAWIDAPATPCLAVLVVQLLELRQRDVEALGRLPALRVLRVDPHANREPLVVPGGAFPRLTECRFRNSDLGPVFWRGAAPGLRRLEFTFRVRNTIDLGNDGFDFGLGNLEVLEEVAVYVACQESTEPEAEAAEAALRAAADAHPNRASFDVITFGEELMRFDDDD